MAPQETAKLNEILEQVSEHRTEFRVFRTEILGGDGEEKPTGRLPRLEIQSADHEKRLIRIERVILMIMGAAGLLKALAWGADSVAHIVEVFR